MFFGTKTVLVNVYPYTVHKVNDLSHIWFRTNYGKVLNHFTYFITNCKAIYNIQRVKKLFSEYKSISIKEIKQAFLTTPTIYPISPILFPPPSYWSDHIQVLGYQERDTILNWQPDLQLLKFIQQHNKILLLTFGSMLHSTPKETTQLFLHILKKNNIPTIINTASGGLMKIDNMDKKMIYFSSQIPYHWIFPKVHAVIHHGGCGTTYLALRCGCASMIIPHIIDQYLWNIILNNLGVGSKGLPIHQLNPILLEKKVTDLFYNLTYKDKALEIAQTMQKENFENKIHEIITN